jgi:hypothetical protein
MPPTGSRVDHRSDAVLLVASDTDPAAFTELYGRHVESVYRWLDRRMGWLAADLTAETFTRAWVGRDRFRDQRGAETPQIRESSHGRLATRGAVKSGLRWW